MQVFLSLIYVCLAGVFNGSFALPTKKIRHWRFENIWLNYAFWAFLIFPWLFMFIVSPESYAVYHHASTEAITIMFIGGLLFGIGQVCFANALNMIGLGLGFLINIGLGTGLGFLMPLIVLHPEKIFTTAGLLTLLGTLFIIIGLIYAFFAGKFRDQKIQKQKEASGHFQLGVLLAIIAGVFSAGQNFTFAATASMQQDALASGINTFSAANVIWPGFLLASFLPYAVYMIILHIRHQSFVNYKPVHIIRYTPLAIIMGVFWYFSLMIYSKASLMIGTLGPVIAWPLFMVMIILSANFWSFQSGEWREAGKRAYHLKIRGVFCLVLAFIILAIGVGCH
ncbi:MAG: hypothetical protein COV52_10165 [Gammaproteobacteria bacterium CG11_big_fil_rev_8_21_14_0_20_46_22]|nr:MAG: hypothetical protein COW05_09390 [Gammaproteobacteria bacterium CG12_big_fil_rev_8_21_14_0_65_46_12]PIR10061.1 MAG: hypothetical protein COV52_10165 [Gammaproteobacteria bacterium CG11_big_fil_rev_8_21_14_0_20_46_22]